MASKASKASEILSSIPMYLDLESAPPPAPNGPGHDLTDSPRSARPHRRRCPNAWCLASAFEGTIANWIAHWMASTKASPRGVRRDEQRDCARALTGYGQQSTSTKMNHPEASALCVGASVHVCVCGAAELTNKHRDMANNAPTAGRESARAQGQQSSPIHGNR